MAGKGLGLQRLTVALRALCLSGLLLAGLPACQDASTEWLQANGIPFDTVEPETGLDDLMFLEDLVGDARIVALGESNHGTHEFFQLKHRLVEYLVEEMGFDLLAVEANWPEADLVNDYIRTCEGDERSLLVGLRYWTWNTQEILDLVQWMCAHNQTSGVEPVSFTGFDMQSPDAAMESVIAFVEQVDPSYAREARIGYSCLRLSRLQDYAERPQATREGCRERVQAVYDHLVAEQVSYEEQSSPELFARAEHSADMVLQAEDCLADFDACERDRYMAENVIWLLQQAGPEARVILWAHNDHVADRITSSGRSMGAYVREAYGRDLLIVGLASGDEGSFNAITYEWGRLGGVDIHQAPEAPRGSYESYFARAEMERMALDLRDVPADTGAEWLTEPRGLRSIGAVYDPALPAEEYFGQVDITAEFDVMIYLEQTTPSLLLSLASLP